MNNPIKLLCGLLQILIIVIMLTRCSVNRNQQESPPPQKTKPMPPENSLEISPQDVKKKLEQKEDFVLIDCREQDEFNLVHIDHSRLVPMSELEQKAGELKDLKQKEIIVYCHHGRRSMMVTKWMFEHGFTNVKSMAGGIDRWSEEIDPKLQRY